MIWSSKEKGVWQVARVLLIEDNNDIQEILYSLLSEDHEVLYILAFVGRCRESVVNPEERANLHIHSLYLIKLLD